MSSDERSSADSNQPKPEDFIPARWSEWTIIANELRQHYYRTSAGEHVAFPGASHFLHHETDGEAFESFIAIVRRFLAQG
jgi:hypothetical protein